VTGRGTGPERLEPALGIRFRDPELLERALTHPSASADTGRDGPVDNYQRLEFLGDRVLGLVIAELLFERFPEEREGNLARRHTQLVRREALTEVGKALDLGAHIRLSRGEEEAGGRHNPAIIADACEAVIGAVFVEGGFEAAKRVILRYWTPLLEKASLAPKDPKTALQEWAQARGLPLPGYRVVAAEGPDHEPVFEVAVSVEGLADATASGRSKRAAETAAARRMLEAIHKRERA
jgi:ribonuclease-3